MREYEVVSVQPIAPSHVAVRFTDGVSGEVMFRKSFFRGVFEAIKDPSAFAKVGCEHGFVEWPGELDLAPDAMYDAIRDHGVWVLE